MRSALFTFLLAKLLMTASSSWAGESAYLCEVSHVYHLSEDQTLGTLPALETELKKHAFSVSRETGRVVAESAIDTSRAKDVRVLNRGSRDNSFRVIADYGRFPNGARPYQLLEIQEFVADVTKPFLIVSELGIVTGTCK